MTEKGKLFERIGRKAAGLFKWRLGCRSYKVSKKPFFSFQEDSFVMHLQDLLVAAFL